jgi:hypothetical protein
MSLRHSRSLVLGLFIALLAATPGFAQRMNDRSGAGSQSAGGPNLLSPYAQAIAHIGQNGSVISAKGFTAVSNPSTGQICLELANGIQIRTAPVVSVDWSNSSGSGLLAFWRPANAGCPGATPRTVNVTTFNFSSGTPTAANTVAFVVLVP